MNSGKYVFRQMLDFVNQYEFNKCVKRYSGNYRLRDFKCWSQFVQLLFGQITSSDSLHSICTCLQAHEKQMYHLGVIARLYKNRWEIEIFRMSKTDLHIRPVYHILRFFTPNTGFCRKHLREK